MGRDWPVMSANRTCAFQHSSPQHVIHLLRPERVGGAKAKGIKRPLMPRIVWRLLLFLHHVLRFLILPKCDELRMPEMIVGSPFQKLELADQRRLDPPAVRHLRCGQASTPSSALGLRKVGKGAFLDFQCLKLPE